MKKSGPPVRRVLIVSVALAVFGVAAYADPPDSRVNPVSGAIETADATLVGSNFEIRHAVNRGQGQPIVVEIVTTNAVDDRSPRIAIRSNGDTWVAWWREGSTPSVLVRQRRQILIMFVINYRVINPETGHAFQKQCKNLTGKKSGDS